MKSMLKPFVYAAAAIAMAMPIGVAHSATQPLPAPNCPVNCLEFNDQFIVYSLTLLNLQAGGGGAPTAGDPFYYAASPGQIANFVVVGNGIGETNVAGIDDAYNTPEANPIRTFTTLATDTSNGPGTGDSTSWQASISALRTVIGDNPLVTFFSFNATGSAREQNVNGPDLLIWARYTLIDTDNPANNQSFYLQNPGTTDTFDPAFNSTGNPNPSATDYANWQYGSGVDQPWVYVHGTICVDGSNNFLGFPDVAGNCTTGSPKSQTNTGANNAAFAVTHDAVSDAVRNSAIYDILQIDWKMDYLNGGAEAGWLQAGVGDTEVPEPGILALIGLGLAGLALSRRRILR